jgi:hypothetical protein
LGRNGIERPEIGEILSQVKEETAKMAVKNSRIIAHVSYELNVNKGDTRQLGEKIPGNAR